MIADQSLLWLACGLSLVLLLRCGRIQIAQPSLRCFACFSMEDLQSHFEDTWLTSDFFFGGGSGVAAAWQFVQVLCQAPSAAVHVSLVTMLREDRAGALNWVGLAGSLAMLSSVVIAHRDHLVTSVDVMRLLFRHQRLLQNRFGLMPSWGMAPADIVGRVRSLAFV